MNDAVGRSGPHRDVAARSVRFAVDRAGHGDDAGAGVDRESAAVVVLQRVGDRVGRRVGVAGRSGDADDRADDRVFIHCVGRAVGIGDRSDVEFIDIVDVDRHHLRC